jgi:hypothetical protein
VSAGRRFRRRVRAVRSETRTNRWVDEHLPGVSATAERARQELINDPRRTCCAHRDPQGAYACAIHPGWGVGCWSCLRDHVVRHDWITEHTCDEHGGIASTVHAFVVPLLTPGLVVHNRSGRRLLLIGEVNLIGLGACPDCIARAEAAA